MPTSFTASRRRTNPSILLLLLFLVVSVPASLHAENLVDGGSFDVPSDVGTWPILNEITEVEWSPEDAALSNTSGSLVLRSKDPNGDSGFLSIRRCFLVTPGLRYQLTARAKIPGNQSNSARTAANLFFYATSNCNQNTRISQVWTDTETAPNTWHELDSGVVVAPEDARSVEVSLGNRKIQDGGSVDVLFDDVRLEELTGDCETTATRLCLTDNRFAIDVEWLTKDGSQGFGTPRSITPDSGLFWFFDANNLEVLVKVLDACAINNSFWVYLAATTDVSYRLTVIDTKTEGIRQYINPQGVRAQAVADTQAFPCS